MGWGPRRQLRQWEVGGVGEATSLPYSRASAAATSCVPSGLASSTTMISKRTLLQRV